ncbi:CLUMA_CG006953, isoform A [Clunio marinus]|uniref:CLUMA_CG006953, isoform A n=1 Tax=Clunio marinus TaxID=568069 RepID=A0A1J1I4W4_9DIPT|nr:CLUMA_CG006953, isoform A [Clunio marinus]
MNSIEISQKAPTNIQAMRRPLDISSKHAMIAKCDEKKFSLTFCFNFFNWIQHRDIPFGLEMTSLKAITRMK